MTPPSILFVLTGRAGEDSSSLSSLEEDSDDDDEADVSTRSISESITMGFLELRSLLFLGFRLIS